MKDKAKQKQFLKDIIKSDEELGLYEDPRYYTPEIEELHVGFEYEFLGQTHWVKTKYGGFLPKHPQYYIDKKEFRVKHLDREDIESLGFISELTKSEIGIATNRWTYNKYTLTKWEKRVEIKINGDYDGEEFHFFGIIKNKSELKRILTQIGVL